MPRCRSIATSNGSVELHHLACSLSWRGRARSVAAGRPAMTSSSRTSRIAVDSSARDCRICKIDELKPTWTLSSRLFVSTFRKTHPPVSVRLYRHEGASPIRLLGTNVAWPPPPQAPVAPVRATRSPDGAIPTPTLVDGLEDSREPRHGAMLRPRVSLHSAGSRASLQAMNRSICQLSPCRWTEATARRSPSIVYSKVAL